MKNILSRLAILSFVILHGCAAPVEIDFSAVKLDRWGSKCALDYVKTMQDKVNKQIIPEMMKIIENPHVGHNPAILDEAFGRGWDRHIGTIKQKIEKIQHGTIKVVGGRAMRDLQNAVVLAWNAKLKQVKRGGEFHNPNVLERNEPLQDVMRPALLALAGLVDGFKTYEVGKFEPLPGVSRFQGEHMVNSAKPKGFERLRRQGGADACVHSVVSYLVLAGHALKAAEHHGQVPAAHPAESSKRGRGSESPVPSDKRPRIQP